MTARDFRAVALSIIVVELFEWQEEKQEFGEDPDALPVRLLPMVNIHGTPGILAEYDLNEHYRLEFRATAPTTEE